MIVTHFMPTLYFLMASGQQSDESSYKSHVLPGVVLSGALVLITVCVLALYRCRRRSRNNVEEGTFIDRRPVVFDNEFIDDAVDMGRPIRPAAVFEYE